MVRTKEKKAKGDSAFTKQKQKVGRKKLAPATTTRAEVHARTLRLNTSTAMSAAMAAPRVADPAKHPASSATTTSGQKATEEKRKRPVIAVQNFGELLSGTHHYKSAQRASSFATLSRLLTAQRERDEAALAVSKALGTSGGASTPFDEYMRYAATAAASDGAATSAGKAGVVSAGLSGLTALEKLKAFAAALEAITDTDDDVRSGALQSLEVMVDFQWISPDRESGAGGTQPRPSSLAAAPATQDAAELARCDGLLMDAQAGHLGEAERVLSSSTSLSAAVSTVSVDRVQAILQAIHVALTHAMKPVRLAGVELLALLLRVAPPPLVRAAARAVCRHQTSYYYSSSVAIGSGATMAGVPRTSARGSLDTANTGSTSALDAAQSRAASLVEEEERWMLTLIRRVSTLVLRTKHVGVLPALLGVFLGHGGDAAPADESVVAALLRSCVDERSAADGGRGATSSADVSPTLADSASPLWRHPELVNHFFDEVAPQWANHWKELMELRLELLRQDEKLAMASALARSFATVLVFLKRQQQQQQQQQQGGDVKGSKVNFFSRNRMYYIKALFIEKMPVTMRELLMPCSGSSQAPPSSSSALSAVGQRSMKARLELGLALVMVCVPLAGTDEGWYLMRDYFSIVFSLSRPAPPSEVNDEGAKTAPPPPQPFRFPSVALLELSVRLYEQVLRLYPCTSPHVHLTDDDAPSDAAAAAEIAVWAGSSVTLAADAPHRRRAARRNSASASAAASQQHSTVAMRLLSFFPALLNTVIKHVAPRGEGIGSAAVTAAASEDAALVRALLCVAQVVERFAAFPDDLLRARGGSASNAHARGGDGSAAAKKLEEGFGLVPRLLFAMREQRIAARPVAFAKRPRAEDDDEKNKEAVEGTEEGGAATGSAATAIVDSRVGVLLAYPGIVDALVRRLLHVLWFLSSSGHPLITSGRSGDAAATPFALLMKKSIGFLFGLSQTGTGGVLQRCAAPTILLAHSILFYLGEVDDQEEEKESKGSTGEKEETATTALAEAADRWADVMGVMRAMA